MIKNFDDLEVYQLSKSLYPEVIELAETIEKYDRSLATQIRRAANSISANIAEGYGRSVAEFKNYLTRSLGSANELISHITDAVSVEYIPKTKAKYFVKHYKILGKKIYRLREVWE